MNSTTPTSRPLTTLILPTLFAASVWLTAQPGALHAADDEAKTPPLPEPDTIEPVEIARTGDYSEGIVVDRDGQLYFSRSGAGKVMKLDPATGELTTWLETPGPNGHKVLPSGKHLVCDFKRHAVLRVSPDGEVLGKAATGTVDGLEIRRPNDICLDGRGGFYFTDSVAETGAVHYVDPEGEITLVERNVNFANGVVLSPEGDRLYFGESRDNRVRVLDLEAPGTPAGPSEVFIDLPENPDGPNAPDGMAVDTAGRLWVTHYGMKAVHVISPAGELLATYDGGNVRTSNICFTGEDNATIYLTGGDPGAIFRLDVGVPGVKLLP